MDRTLKTPYVPFVDMDDENDEEPPGDTIIQLLPDQDKSRWSHIEDLDKFFTRVYRYHQRGGFRCMLMEDFCQLVHIVVITSAFVILVAVISSPDGCEALFNGGDVLKCMNATAYIGTIIGIAVSVFAIFKNFYNLTKYLEMRSFYCCALQIHSNDLENMTWHEVQRRLLEVQKDLKMCIHKPELTELDIYHRMLRFKNYLVAMVNKSVLQTKFDVPCVGKYVYLTNDLLFSLEFILFWGPWAPFENSWHLKKEYKSNYKKKELGDQLCRRILWTALANLFLCPFIFTWKIIYIVLKYLPILRGDPAVLSVRSWSPYARLYLRHFNELDHELNARLNRAYHPAKKYIDSFSTRLIVICAELVCFLAGATMGVVILIKLKHEEIRNIDFAAVMAGIIAVFYGARAFIPKENTVFCPEQLMRAVQAQVHYLPDAWIGQMHNKNILREFSQFFPYSLVMVFEELLSPIFTPLILAFHFRQKSHDFVEFFHNFTVEVAGVGDVCSFAMMDIKKHGHPEWGPDAAVAEYAPRNPVHQAEFGKTELSLIHFNRTNPEWKPQQTEDQFLKTVKTQVQKDGGMISLLPLDNPFVYSSYSSAAPENASLMFSTAHKSLIYPSQHYTMDMAMQPSCNSDPTSSSTAISPPTVMRGAIRNLDYPSSMIGGSGVFASIPLRQKGDASKAPAEASRAVAAPDATRSVASPIISSLSPNEFQVAASHGHQGFDESAMERLSAEMSASALYLHDLHQWKKFYANAGTYEDERARRMWQVNARSEPSSPPGPSSRMPNIQEGAEDTEVMTGSRGTSAERDYLLGSSRNVSS